MEASSIESIGKAVLCGSLFDPNDSVGLVNATHLYQLDKTHGRSTYSS